MTDDTQQQPGAGETLPATPPKSDAEAAAQPVATPEPVQEDAAKAEAEAKAKEEGESRKRNRTRDYIAGLNRDNAELRRQLAELARPEAPKPQQPQATGPKLEEFTDFADWQNARDRWVIENAQATWTEQQKRAEAQRQQTDLLTTYNDKVLQFADQTPDFFEAVGSIDPRFLTNELQQAVMAHEKGPEIAYFLANDDEALFNIASIRPELQAAAVERLASRLSAAPPPPANPLAGIASQPKPITQAPPPPPQVGGRAASETPSEKLTDDEWYARELAKSKRG